MPFKFLKEYEALEKEAISLKEKFSVKLRDRKLRSANADPAELQTQARKCFAKIRENLFADPTEAMRQAYDLKLFSERFGQLDEGL